MYDACASSVKGLNQGQNATCGWGKSMGALAPFWVEVYTIFTATSNFERTTEWSVTRQQ